MATSVQMPKLGESIVEGTVARWLKAPGERVTKLEPLLEISTDKIDTELPAPASGILLEILVAEGRTVGVGTVLARIGEANSVVQSTKSPAIPNAPATPSPPKAELDKPSGRGFVSPVVARMAREHEVDLDQIAGSGLGGRVTKKDIEAYLERRSEPAEIEEISTPVQPVIISQPAAISTPLPVASNDEILHPLSTMRRAIAQHMLQSKQTSPHVTTLFEVDMLAVVRHREANKKSYAEKGLALTFTPYFAAATVAGLRAVPFANARFSEQGILVNRRIHLGIAVATQHNAENGLLVPVIRDADEKNLAGLTRAVNELSEQARTGKLSPDALWGGTFTVTNHGVGGSLAGTPIINQPQSAILGVGAIVKRPVVINTGQSNSLLPSADDAIVIRPICFLSLSFDHRVLDGASADQFLTVVKQTLENWQ